MRFRRFHLLLPIISFSAFLHAGPVTIEQSDAGQLQLMKDGQPFFIKGAGGNTHLKVLKESGGNSIRTWGVEALEEKVDGKTLLQRCEELGLGISVGIWIGHQRHGFDYGDTEMVEKQRDMVRKTIETYKDHPSILTWGLGNEMEGPMETTGDPAVWRELNELAGIIKSIDTDHPVMTVIAGTSAGKVKSIIELYPNIDILGVNVYGGAASVGASLKSAGWTKPFVLSEFGPRGHWEVAKTPWGAPIEPTSREKAASYYASHELGAEGDAGDCLGSYCFVWGQKQETTSTWYGMFLPTGEKLPVVDAMCRAWTEAWPANRCPKLVSLKSSAKGAVVAPGQLCAATIDIADPDGHPLSYDWQITAESTDTKVGGDKESVPPSYPDCIVYQDAHQIAFKAPEKPGAYRVFIFVRDGQGGASADNFCFRVGTDQ